MEASYYAKLASSMVCTLCELALIKTDGASMTWHTDSNNLKMTQCEADKHEVTSRCRDSPDWWMDSRKLMSVKLTRRLGWQGPRQHLGDQL